MNPVLRRVLWGTGLALAVVGLLWGEARASGEWDGVVAYGAALVLSVAGTIELVRMSGHAGWRLGGLPVAALLVALPSWQARDELYAPDAPALGLLAGSVLAALIALATARRRGAAVVLAVWGAVPLFGLVGVVRTWGVAGLSVLVVLSKIGDVFGYFVGRAIGKRHPFPKLSPGKTVAGCVASLVAGTASGAAIALLGWFPGTEGGVLEGAAVGLLLNLAAQSADLFESFVKRRAGVKDSSTWLGASGGVLDVVDSLLFTVPVALLVWPPLLGTG